MEARNGWDASFSSVPIVDFSPSAAVLSIPFSYI